MEIKSRLKEGLPVFNVHAAGIDVRNTPFDVSISDEKSWFVTKEYGCFMSDLHEIVSDLQRAGITNAAMERTGIYWLNIYLLLEECVIEPYLVHAKLVKNVTGRKKDDTDAIWI